MSGGYIFSRAHRIAGAPTGGRCGGRCSGRCGGQCSGRCGGRSGAWRGCSGGRWRWHGCSGPRGGAGRNGWHSRVHAISPAGGSGYRDERRSAAGVAVLLLALVTGSAATQQNGGEPSPPPAAVTAAVATVAELTFTPELFHVGDRVMASIVLDTGRGLVLTPPAALPVADWTVIHTVEVLPHSAGRWEVRVGFSSFQPGVLTLPPIDVGPFLLQNVRVQAASLLPTSGGGPLVLRPLRRQLALPGTTAGLLSAAIGLLAVPHLLVSGVLALLRGARRWRVQRTRNLPRAQLRQGVSRLHAGTAPPTALAFYVELAQLLRTYLAQRLQIPARAATTRELRAALPALGFPDRLGSELTAILDTADRVKFAGQPSDRSEMLALSERLVTLVDEIDGDLQRRERAAAERAAADPPAAPGKAPVGATTGAAPSVAAGAAPSAGPGGTARGTVGGAGVEL